MATYYNDIETSKLVNSPQFTETFNTTYYIDGEVTEEKLAELGVYVQGNVLMKNYTMNVDGNANTVQWRMTVDKLVGQDRYEVKPRGIALDMDLSKLIQDGATAYGYDIDDYTNKSILDDMLTYAEEIGDAIDVNKRIARGVIDKYGRSSYDYRLMDIVQNYFEQFPNIDNPYTPIQKPIPTGENFITDYDHSYVTNNFIGADVSSVTDYITPKQLDEQFKSLKEDDDDLKEILNNSSIVRIISLQGQFPTHIRVLIYGYKLENSKIVTTNETGDNQRYGGLVTYYKFVAYGTSNTESTYPTLVKYNQGEGNLSLSTTFYNYAKWGAIDTYGFLGSGSAGVGFGTVVDSIGNTTVGNSIQPISSNHSRWYSTPTDPSDPYVPVGSIPNPGTTPTIETQTIIREGIPPIRYIPKPIGGIQPVVVIDDPADETTDDLSDAPYIMGNAYNPTTDELDAFYTWIWDRDTWTEKQKLNNNPLEAVISLHALPIPESSDEYEWSTGSDKYPLALGFLEAQNEGGETLTSSKVIGRYKKFEFGYVDIPRTYGDFRDFDREIYIFLPYIGFRQLRCDDVTAYKGYISTRVYLDYNIDLLSGDFVAEITIDKNVADRKLLYTFNGNMATVMPISATDKSRLQETRARALGGVGTTALGLGSAIALTGIGAPVGAIVGALGAGLAGAGTMMKALYDKANQNMASIQRSDALSGNIGALSPRTPYIIINSPIPYDANYMPYAGDTTNITIQLGQLSGYTRCKSVHVDTLGSATNYEKNEIESLLTSGVIL